MPDPEEELKKAVQKQQTRPTGMAFLDFVNLRLDHVRAYNSHKHYLDTFYICRNWIKIWGKMMCEDIKRDMVQAYVFVRSKRDRTRPRTKTYGISGRSSTTGSRKAGFRRIQPRGSISCLSREGFGTCRLRKMFLRLSWRLSLKNGAISTA